MVIIVSDKPMTLPRSLHVLPLVEQLSSDRNLDDSQLNLLLETDKADSALFAAADAARRRIYGDEVYIRGLIEFTN